MPIEIRELRIKVTISTQSGAEEAFLFGGAAPGVPDGEDRPPDDLALAGDFGGPAGDDLADLALRDGQAVQREHTGVTLSDGSVQFGLEPFDLLG